MCHKYGLRFEEVSEKYGILQNWMDKFRGEEIAILYDPGMFPALLKDSNGKQYTHAHRHTHTHTHTRTHTFHERITEKSRGGGERKETKV